MADGTPGNDTFTGGATPELYNGLAGADSISGAGGNDTLTGGAGNDTIRGGSENDSIDGGTENDSLDGDSGNDTLVGGDGKDTFDDYEGANSQSGGIGEDSFIYVGFSNGVDTLTGGAGRDTYRAYFPLSAAYAADIITDFVTGTGGDIVDLTQFGLSLPSGANPFLTGFLRLVQAGTSVELQGDQDGGGNNWKTVIVFQNASAGAFTAANFIPGYNPTGVGETLTGNDGANTITGTVNDDTILGFGGADTLNGNDGNDSIDGGQGADNLDGGNGADTVIGGTGADTLAGSEGNDSLLGGEGQDRFNVDSGNDTFDGGDGDDSLGDYVGTNVLRGGGGADYFEYVSFSTGVDTLTGGTGSDVYNVYFPFSSGYVADIVTDFATGVGGDVIRLATIGFSGLPSGANPFTTGFLRLFQAGANVQLQADQDGGGDNWRTILVLENNNVANFAATNFDPPFSPTGTGLTINGSDVPNGIQGTPDGDVIAGNGGDDTIDANAGADTVDAGSGDDTVQGDFGNDTIAGGLGNDNLSGGGDNDTIDGGDGNDRILGEQGNDSLVGGLGDDSFTTEAGDDTFVGGDGNDSLGDYQGANSLSGGAGEDYFEYVSFSTGVDTLTGGTGRDTFRVYFPDVTADIVTDFQTGAEGDVVRLDAISFTNLPTGDNPFTTGHARLLQSGANVVLQLDTNGGGDAYQTVLVLQNTNVANFAATNFDPPYSPVGAGLTITANDLPNGIAGSFDGDTISALGGDDTINANNGDDSVDAGSGNDSLYGGNGDDTLRGGDGEDRLYGEQGNDSLVGGLGDDSFTTEAGDDTFEGGDGNDSLGDYQGANSLSGGGGDDYFEYVAFSDDVDTLTGGAGRDTFNVFSPFSTGYVADIVTDFQTGSGGDIIGLNGFSGLLGGANPFTTGHARLLQVGADVQLQLDQDGGGDEYRIVLVLRNTNVANFTAANFDPGFNPIGIGITVTGSEAPNRLNGTLDGDTIVGLGGDDTLDGNSGNDSLDGGSGDDFLYGNNGNDTLIGGSGDDYLYGQGGNDSADGGDGNDRFENDTGNDTFVGGAGDDTFLDYTGNNSMSGGAGDDYFRYVSFTDSADTLTGGAGRDVYTIYYPLTNGYVADIITDFQGGAGGDFLDLTSLYPQFTGYTAGTNPFTSGHLRLLQSGADTLLQADLNGGGDAYVTVLVLQNTTAGAVLPANFIPDTTSDGTGLNQTTGNTPDTLTGTVDGDSLRGGAGNDTISGLGGNDTLYGEGDNDSVAGGDGNDVVFGGAGTDRLSGDDGGDAVYGEAGSDTLLGGGGNDQLDGGSEADSLDGGTGNDRVDGNTGNDTQIGGEGDDSFYDYQGADSIVGGVGDDYFEYVSYDAGIDTLTGGAGRDTYNLFTNGTASIVTDFQTGVNGDVIDLPGFNGLPTGANPFTSGFARLVQAGADVQVQLDLDGGANAYVNYLTLQNTNVAAFTASNFEPAYSPTGTGITLNGSLLDDNLTGSNDGDTISALDGNDNIDANFGNDSVEGGTGNDTLTGDIGNDTLRGGDGTDQVSGGDGNDSLEGGTGNDNIDGEAGNDTQIGGDGDDSFNDYRGADSMVGGDGDDLFQYVSYDAAIDTLTGGAGRDTYIIYPFGTASIVTDFQTGSGGDIINLPGFSGLPTGTNPFTSGHARLTQSGSNVLLQIDQNGGGDAYVTMLTLQNTNAAAFTGSNFGSGFNPAGTGLAITGTPLADALVGTPDADTITALDSNDTINAGFGNDIVDAGGGNDNISASYGNDSITAGTGSDTGYGGEGNDTLRGGDGNDYLQGDNGNDSITGDIGQDSLYGDTGDDTLAGGDGADYLSDYQGANSIDGGAGVDYFEYVSFNNGVDTLTGGTGSDVFNLLSVFGTGYVADRITDFQTGAGGDVLRLASIGFSNLATGQSPFTSGHLRLVQAGSDVQLQADQDGGGNSWRTILVLANTNAAAFTAANFDPGYSPTGIGAVITGTPLVDNLVGTPDGDMITGLEGADTIDANFGNDSVDAGAGADTIRGDFGNDTLDGGDGNDYLYGEQGDDSLLGGEGQDLFTPEDGNDTYRGGGGDDNLGDYIGTNVIDGGAGEDFIEYASYLTNVDTLTGGAGTDTFSLFFPFGAGYVADVVTDFTPGNTGDVVRLTNIGFSGLAAGANPFLTGHLRLFQQGADTLLQGDQNGGGDAWRTVLVLQNVSASALTGVNFDPAYDPTGIGLTFIGTPNGDAFAGSVNADRAEGRDGADTLDGNAGADTILGEGGNDSLIGDEGADSLDGGSNDDTLFGGADNDTLIGGDGNDSLRGDGGADQIQGGIGLDTLNGGDGNDTIGGGDNDDVLNDFEGANSLSGGSGADYFGFTGYQSGVDTLSGGIGVDTYNLFVPFQTGSVADIVTDFAPGAGGDVVRLNDINFSNLAANGNPFASGHLRLIQNGANVELQGDQDGGGNAYVPLLVFQNTTLGAFTSANFSPAYDLAGSAAPDAVGDAVMATEDAATTILASTLLANDTDPNPGDTLTLQSVSASSSAGASVSLSGGNVVYNPGAIFNGLRAGQSGTDAFSYTVRDTGGLTDTATVTVTITGANDGPSAVANAVSVAEDAVTANLVSTLLANDTDPDAGDTRSIVAVATAGTRGTVVFNQGTQTLTYSADDPSFDALDPGQSTTTTFTYTIADAAGAQSTASVTVTVTGVDNDSAAPDAVNDAVSVAENGATTVLAATLLANDTDPNGDTLSVSAVAATSAAGASVSLTGGNVVYNPGALFDALRAGQSATDSFGYTARDPGGLTDTATVTVTVVGANDGPSAVADAVGAAEDGATTILASTLLANDTDPDAGDSRAIQSVQAASASGAALSLSGGNVVYNPGALFNGLRLGQTATDTFAYTMVDGAGATSTATVTVTITGANDAPAAGANAVSVAEDAVTANLVSTLLANDTDPDAGDTRSIVAVATAGTRGTLVFNQGTQTLTYSADDPSFDALDPGQSTTTTFTYTIADAAGAQSTASVTVTITGVDNDSAAPDAVNDAVSVAENGATTVLAATLLANDTDPNGDTLSVSAVAATSAAGASVSLTGGNVVYNPGALFDALRAGQSATDSFGYTARDPSGLTDTATVTVTVIGANDGPSAAADAVGAAEDGATTILASTLLANDTDPDAGDSRAIQSVQAASASGAALSLSGGNVVYNPGALFNTLRLGQTATDTFAYTMVDGAGATSTATVTVTITGANDGPSAVANAVSVAEDAVTANLVSTLLANDTDPDAGDTRSIVAVATAGTRGTLVFNQGTQTLTYSADDPSFDALDPGQSTTTTFTYTIADAAGAQSTASVTVTVTGVDNDSAAPDAVNDAVSVAENGATTVLAATLLANDTDPNGDTLSVSAVAATSAAGASVSLTGGNVVYNPGALFDALRAGQSATDSFGYTARDPSGLTDTATVTVTVIGANDGPSAAADAVGAAEDGATTILASTLLANDTDPDAGDSRAIQSVQAASASGAALSLSGGNVVYNPGALFNTLRLGQTATDTFGYTMVDGAGATSTATVTVTITGANDAPDAVNNGGFTTASGTPLSIAISTLLANDTDPDVGDVLNVTSVQGAANGTVALNGSQVVFTPNAGYSGAASFTYAIGDGQGGSDTATVSLTVQAQGTGLNLRGTPNDDTLTGGAFNDLINGRGSDDILVGNGGADQFRFLANEITGAKDRDLLADLDFAQGDTLVFGSYGPGTFFDASGVNAFAGGAAATLSSWSGIVSATNASAQVTGARATGDPDNFVLIVTKGGQTQEIEIVDGWQPYLAAGGSEGVGGITLRGSPADDVLVGGGGPDKLTGRGGDDVLTGNFGADQFRFYGNEIGGAADRDRITDLTFAQGDTLVFGNYAEGTFADAAGVSAFTNDSAAFVRSWEGIVSVVDGSALVTAARETPSGNGLVLILSNGGGQIQEIVIANGWSQYVAAGGTEGLM